MTFRRSLRFCPPLFQAMGWLDQAGLLSCFGCLNRCGASIPEWESEVYFRLLARHYSLVAGRYDRVGRVPWRGRGPQARD
ncbi:MAG: hypothetical protein ABF785_05140 [Acetobacter papayae]|uniref:hypothetical protein n=1 Tax=Acetobacter papayae TaxID=1076592 RepID=UPI0039ECA1D9